VVAFFRLWQGNGGNAAQWLSAMTGLVTMSAAIYGVFKVSPLLNNE
jgi:hypothetical protein